MYRRQQEAEKAGPKRLAKRNWTPAQRGLACAACALALAVGTVSVRPAGNGGSDVPAVQYAFGLTAYAAEDRILTDDKAPVEVLGMRELDRIIGRELDKIQEIYQTEGVSGLLALMG